MSELHEVWCPDVIGLGFGVWGNPIVMLFKKKSPTAVGSSPMQVKTHHDEYSDPEELLNVIVSLLLIIIDEGAGDV